MILELTGHKGANSPRTQIRQLVLLNDIGCLGAHAAYESNGLTPQSFVAYMNPTRVLPLAQKATLQMWNRALSLVY
jgi:hypothetical protein